MSEDKEFKSFFKTVGGNEGNKCHYPTRLDTYGCGCSHDCKYCLDGDTNILMYDGSSKKLRDLNIGDEVYGVTFDGKYYRYTKSIIENKWTTQKESFKITLANGTELICSGNHRWLTPQGWKYTKGNENEKVYLSTQDSIMGLSASNDLINLNDTHITDSYQILSIEKYQATQELYDITTSTQNFIANGVVSHNCYAKSLLDFRKLWNPTNPSVANIEKIRKVVSKLTPDTPAIRLGGMTDCFQPIEATKHITYETIKIFNEYRVPYLIVTKSALVATDEYINIMDKHLAHIQITVTTTDDELSKTYEKASVPSERIKAIEKLQANGFDVTMRLSPFIPEYLDFSIINSVKCDKVLVEFLRANTWIKKWFNVDYSKWTVKQDGYAHLPLEEKLQMISKLQGFKQMSVCEDESEAYEFWNKQFNHNPEDCCNLRRLDRKTDSENYCKEAEFRRNQALNDCIKECTTKQNSLWD